MIQIRPSQLSDLDRLMEIFDHARKFMASAGNGNQWINGYPQRELLKKSPTDIVMHAKMSTEKSLEHFVSFRVPILFIPLSKMEPG